METVTRACLVCGGLTWLVVATLAALEATPGAVPKGRIAPVDVRVAVAFDAVAARTGPAPATPVRLAGRP